MKLNLTSADKKIPINEYYGDNVLYNKNGVEVHYGFDGKKEYGAIDENSDEFFFGGIEKSGGLHSIQLSRPLAAGERVVVNWRNGYQLIIWSDGDKTRVKRRKGGSYQESGKWKDEGFSENNVLLFDDSVDTKRFDYIETKIFEEF